MNRMFVHSLASIAICGMIDPPEFGNMHAIGERKHSNLGKPIREEDPERKAASGSLQKMLKRKGRK